MAKSNTQSRYPALITVATQADLDHPEWENVCRFWGENYDRIRVVIPMRAKAKEQRGIVFHRMMKELILLRDVVEIATRMVNQSSHPGVVIQDPLVAAGRPVLSTLSPAFLKDKHQGNAWGITGQALRMEGQEPQGIEEGILRWFALAENTLNMLFSGSAPVPAHIPFEQPVWSGWLAGWLQSRLMETRYHDITGLHTIASWMPPAPDLDLTGYGLMTFNPPTRSYTKELNDILPT